MQAARAIAVVAVVVASGACGPRQRLGRRHDIGHGLHDHDKRVRHDIGDSGHNDTNHAHDAGIYHRDDANRARSRRSGRPPGWSSRRRKRRPRTL